MIKKCKICSNSLEGLPSRTEYCPDCREKILSGEIKVSRTVYGSMLQYYVRGKQPDTLECSNCGTIIGNRSRTHCPECDTIVRSITRKQYVRNKPLQTKAEKKSRGRQRNEVPPYVKVEERKRNRTPEERKIMQASYFQYYYDTKLKEKRGKKEEKNN
jgi:hypothetical protein